MVTSFNKLLGFVLSVKTSYLVSIATLLEISVMIDFKAKLNSYKKMLICALVDKMVEKASGSIIGKPPLLVSRVEVALHHANHIGRVYVNIWD